MARDNEYHIYVHVEGLSDNNGAVAGAGTGSSDTEDIKGDKSASAVASAAKKLVSFAAVASTADKIISNNISMVALETGANEYEQRLNTAYSLAKQIGGAGISLIGGALMGGPAGLAIATIGIVASGINKVINLEQRQRELQVQRSLENVSIGMANIRAGTSGRRSSNQ